MAAMGGYYKPLVLMFGSVKGSAGLVWLLNLYSATGQLPWVVAKSELTPLVAENLIEPIEEYLLFEKI